MRIPQPNFTQTPNDLFDHWLPFLGEVELKVLLVIMRKTFGWHKVRDKISISQLEKLTGSTPTNIGKAIKSLISKGVILKQVTGENGKQETFYELAVCEDSNNSYPCQDRSATPPESGGVTPPDSGVTKETLLNKKKQQQQPVVVVSSDQEKESIERLQKLGFDEKTCQEMKHYSVELINRQIEEMRKINEVKEIKNPLGWLRKAIEGDWKTSEAKKSKEQEENEKERESASKTKVEAEKMKEKFKHLFTEKTYFEVQENCISFFFEDPKDQIPSWQSRQVIPYWQNGCLSYLENFINTKLKNGK